MRDEIFNLKCIFNTSGHFNSSDRNKNVVSSVCVYTIADLQCQIRHSWEIDDDLDTEFETGHASDI